MQTLLGGSHRYQRKEEHLGLPRLKKVAATSGVDSTFKTDTPFVGPRSAAKAAAFGGVLLAMIEGLGILLTRATAPPPAPPMMDMAPSGAPLPQPGVPSAMSGIAFYYQYLDVPWLAPYEFWLGNSCNAWT